MTSSDKALETGRRTLSIGDLVRGLFANALVLVATVWLILVAVVIVFGQGLAPADPSAIALDRRLLPPGSNEEGLIGVLGTDQLGRDYLSRLITGARSSVVLGLTAATVSTALGLLVGSLAGYLGGRTDAAVSRLVDAQLSFPGTLFALLILASLGPSVGAVLLVLCFAGIPSVVRLARGLALQIRPTGYVEAAKALNASSTHIVRRHVTPNILTPVLVYGTTLVAGLMLASAGLDFLGLGIQPPETSWGALVSTGRDSIQRAWWLVALPGIAIFLTALSVNLVALAVRDFLESGRRPTFSLRRPAIPSQLVAVAAGLPASPSLIDEFGTMSEQQVGQAHPSDLVAATQRDEIPRGPAPVLSDPPRDAVLAVDQLVVDYVTQSGVARAVRGVSWSVAPGEVVAIVGESGSGKSATVKTIMGILERPHGIVRSGRILISGQDILAMTDRRRRQLYGRVISMVQQDAVAALNPVMTVGAHLAEAIRVHAKDVSAIEVTARSVELLRQVGISDADRRLKQYPFQLSGGMCQRVLIAMAIVNRPSVIVADEPTTALDVTYQAQIMDLLMDLRAQNGMALVLVTHDLALVSQRADRVVVMYGGQVMESGLVKPVIDRPGHPYTEALLDARPKLSSGRASLKPVPGSPPNAARLPPGCPFNPRCAKALPICSEQTPQAVRLSETHWSACHRALEVHGA